MYADVVLTGSSVCEQLRECLALNTLFHTYANAVNEKVNVTLVVWGEKIILNRSKMNKTQCCGLPAVNVDCLYQKPQMHYKDLRNPQLHMFLGAVQKI